MTRKKSRPQPAPAPKDVQTDALTRYAPLLGEDGLACLVAEQARPLPAALRLNPFKVDAGRAISELSGRYGWQVSRVPFCPLGWQVLEAPGPISQTSEHRAGQYYIQDAASMLPVELFDMQNLPEHPVILDMAASPGGKTTHLVDRSGDVGLVIANDASPSRLQALRIVLQNWGAANTAITGYSGDLFGQAFPETFDAVLLDAPCSMENLRSTESHPMRPISPSERRGLAQRQLRLLESALRTVKPGGQIVYSTCTLAPEEDEGVLDELMQMYPMAVQIEPPPQRLGIQAPGLEGDGVRQYHPDVSLALRLWPHTAGTSGFFAARLTKIDSLPGSTTLPPQRPFEKTGLTRLSTKDLETLGNGLMESYGLEIFSWLEEQSLTLWQRGNDVYAIPDLYMSLFAELPYHSLGLLVGQHTPDGFIPAHDWLARFNYQVQSQVLDLPAEFRLRWLAGEDFPNNGLPFAARSMVMVRDEAGCFLGRGRVLPGRIKQLRR